MTATANVVSIETKHRRARAFRLVTCLRRLATAADVGDELSVIELHGAMLAAAREYGPAEWDRLWTLAGFAKPVDPEVIAAVMCMLRDLTGEA